MKNSILPIVILLVFLIVFTGCGSIYEEPYEQEADAEDQYEFAQSLSDWVLGTDYGINDAVIDTGNKTITLYIDEADRQNLQDFEFEDINESLINLAEHFVPDEGYSILWENGEYIAASGQSDDNDSGEEQAEEMIVTNPNSETVNLIFIHHSVGENWLNDGLNDMLNDNNYHVADTYYGWSDMGDRTDTVDWPNWFNDDVMPSVYRKLDNETAYNNIEPAPGENTIIMFKSCFPNSEVGRSIDDEKAVYNSLLDYFEKHTDKMFVLITPPPMQRISKADNTRELTNWLVDENGYRKNYKHNNLYIFDLYNVFTSPDNHHYIMDGKEEHIVADASNTLYYDSDGDDHPNGIGNKKAANEFIPLLNFWYKQFRGE